MEVKRIIRRSKRICQKSFEREISTLVNDTQNEYLHGRHNLRWEKIYSISLIYELNYFIPTCLRFV